jgi:zinc protease
MRRLRAAAGGAATLLLALTLLAAPAARAVDVQRVVSPGGIEAWLVESNEVPVIAVDFAFRGAGASADPADRQGLSNLVSTLLDEGAGDLDSAAFQRRLTDNAIDLSFNANADDFRGSLKTVTERADTAFALLRLALTDPRFDAEAVDRMKAAVLADIRRRVADPGWMARRAYFEAAFPGHAYGRPSRGTAASLAAIGREDLHRFVRERIARDNLVIGVTGDIDAEELAARLDETFGALQAASVPRDVAEAAPTGGDARILVERAGPQSSMLIVQPGIARDDPDYYAAYVLNHVLGGSGFTSRLAEEVRQERGLTYGIYSYLAIFDRAELMIVGSSLSNENVGEALEVVRGIWREVAAEGVTAEEVADARTYLTGSFPLNFTSTDRISSMLVTMQLTDLGIDYLDRRNALIESVTAEDVGRVAAELLRPDALSVVVVGAPGDSFDPMTVIDSAALAARELSRPGGEL